MAKYHEKLCDLDQIKIYRDLSWTKTNVLTFSTEWPSRTKSIIGRDLKFAVYVPHYKILTLNIFGLILKNKMAATGISLSVIKSAYISLIIGPRVLGW